ncbi:MAG: uncharacterized protein JWN98_1129 [Abditibacteriota bacterium]|nr:uncharacterized protein [Abditibacteriota bacterium]
MNRLLWELQQTDNLITRLRREKSKLDDGTHARSERDTLARVRNDAKARLATLNSQRGDKEAELQATEEKIARQNTRLMNAKNAHEVSSLQRDIAALGHARGDLDEAILMLMEEAESAARTLADLEAQLQTATAHATAIEQTFAAETTRYDGELKAAQAQRESTATQLDAESKAKYDEVAKARGGIAVAIPQNGNCSACGMELTTFNLREAKSQIWPICESCYRLLFVE